MDERDGRLRHLGRRGSGDQQAGSPAVIRGNRMELIYPDIIVACQHTLIGENSYDRIGQYLFTKDLPSGPQIDVSSTGFIQGPHPQFDQK